MDYFLRQRVTNVQSAAEWGPESRPAASCSELLGAAHIDEPVNNGSGRESCPLMGWACPRPTTGHAQVVVGRHRHSSSPRNKVHVHELVVPGLFCDRRLARVNVSKAGQYVLQGLLTGLLILRGNVRNAHVACLYLIFMLLSLVENTFT